MERQLERKSGDRKDWTDLKSFQKLDKFDGSAKVFTDWEFQFHQFIRAFKIAMQWMTWVKDQDAEIANYGATEKAKEVKLLHPGVNLEEHHKQPYGVLSLLCTGTALQTAKNQKVFLGIRGVNSCWNLIRSCREDRGAT